MYQVRTLHTCSWKIGFNPDLNYTPENLGLNPDVIYEIHVWKLRINLDIMSQYLMIQVFRATYFTID